MTQKNLADKLFVSSQAVSRWENGEVEPSISTIMELAKIFEVSTDEIIGLETNKSSDNESQTKKEEKQNTQEPPRQFLAVCEQCNRPIYNSNEIIRKEGKVFCPECNKKNNEKKRFMEENRRLLEIESAKNRRLLEIESAKKRRILSFIFGGLGAIVALIIILTTKNAFTESINIVPTAIFTPISIFTFISCCILNNNFVGHMFLSIATWSIKLPGLIFTFDLDGCLWFIGMKILFAILGFIFGILAFLLAWTISLPVSLFVYPYAIVTNIKKPENKYW
ncbi:MAG: helix-turn-helix domain-containing protein [Clostridia bacterium]|nr:helix-turn-helix domain-containing protein [Clostridia bacterium]